MVNIIVYLFRSVIKGYGQYDISHPADDQVIPSPSNCPYLLLDIRDPDDYRQCSITTGLVEFKRDI